ncbi:hypothetical protein LTR70_004230 [Exophiala xenobiotica]|uniref:Uncharacterized protein n=1 Tax=Lithohypha guttulata TaxID=1690604 RepID=A0ABR0KFB7_9EURO|nr:hypothetical protein LTR24_003712 [Lithohypha guttulata]KAK5321517.1 hypothetical protein LTR70_004230 [Exophiala xenobiotica]
MELETQPILGPGSSVVAPPQQILQASTAPGLYAQFNFAATGRPPSNYMAQKMLQDPKRRYQIATPTRSRSETSVDTLRRDLAGGALSTSSSNVRTS